MRTVRNYSGLQYERDMIREHKKALIQERIRRSVRRKINEELLLIEQHKRTCDLIIIEERRMLSEGYTRDEINEGIMDFIGKIPGGYMSYLKQFFIEMLMSKLGMDPDKGLLAYALKNVLEEMEWTNVTKYFGKGGCKPLTDLLLRGMQEAVAEKGLDMVAQMLFGSRKLSGFMSGTGREMITDWLKTLTEHLREPISKYICGMDFSSIAGGLKGMMGGGGGPDGGKPGANPPAGGLNPDLIKGILDPSANKK